tara:strand:- start:2875 stop:4599 length:1725 start_codon:yes stop_codon:yes gene_type:complete
MTCPSRLQSNNFILIKIFLAILIVLGFGLRFYKPAADPPQWSYIFNTDEGHYSYNTLNKAKDGKWFLDEAKYALVTPLFSVAQYLIGLIFHDQPNIVRYRAISVLSGIISCLLIAFIVDGKWIRLSAVALLSMSFIGTVHSRLGISEIMLTLFFQLTVLLAWQAYQRNFFLISFLTGLSAIGCLTIKPTGVIILPVILLAPLICDSPGNNRKLYWKGVISGFISGILLWSIIIVVPNWNEWQNMMVTTMSFGKNSISYAPVQITKSYLKFFLSPALHTMPLLWPLALFWCAIFFLAKFRNRKNTFLDSLLFLWLIFGIGSLGSALYQPGRWQLFLFPPVIISGLRFLQLNPRAFVIYFSFLFAGSLSVIYSIFWTGQFLEVGGQIHPEYGLFSHVVPATLAFFVFFVTYHIIKKFSRESCQAIAYAVIVLELSVQCTFHLALMVPSYYRQSQWTNIAADMEKLMNKKEDIITGDMVQNLALYADVHVLPTFYVLDENDDKSIKKFYLSQNRIPTYIMLADFKHKYWWKNSPKFMKSLQEVQKYSLFIGDVGWRVFRIYRIKSYEWLYSHDNLAS